MYVYIWACMYVCVKLLVMMGLITLSLASTRASLSQSAFTTAGWPSTADKVRAVSPCYQSQVDT